MYPGVRAERYPERVALIMADGGDNLTYAQFEARANKLAQFFRKQGLENGDRVSFLMCNSLDLVVAMGGGERTGLYYTPINFHLTAKDAALIVNDSESRIVVTTADLAELAAELPDLCPKVERWLMHDRPAGVTNFEDYDEALADCPPTPVPDEKLGLALLYSSGTTGRPKGVLRPMPDVDPREPLPVFQLVPQVYHTRDDMIFLQPGPLYHSGPQSAVAQCLRSGSTCIIMTKFDARRFLELVEQYGVTHTQVVPTMMSRILQLPDEVRLSYDTSTLESIAHGAAPCPISVKRAMIDWLGPILYENYGSTEANGSVKCDSHEWLAHPGTVGRAFLGELKILDDDLNEVPVGETGTVWIKGATRFVYINDPERTAAGRAADGDMSTTGDIGYLDEDGYLYLTGRTGFLIISGGVNISPQEIEDVLIEHPLIADAAVIGVPDPDLGEIAKAFVELKAGVSAPRDFQQGVLDFCATRLAKFLWPRSVEVVDRLPRNEAGKLVKRELAELHAARA